MPSPDVFAEITGRGKGTIAVLANVRTSPRVSALVEIQIVFIASFVRALIAGIVSNVPMDFHVVDKVRTLDEAFATDLKKK